MGSFGDKWVCPPVPFKNRWARLCRLRTAGSYFPEGSLYPAQEKKRYMLETIVAIFRRSTSLSWMQFFSGIPLDKPLVLF